MKKLLLGLFIAAMLCCLAGCGGATGENVTGILTTENSVNYDPKCPECGHISLTKMVNLCEGESYETYHECEACNHVYEIKIER